MNSFFLGGGGGGGGGLPLTAIHQTQKRILSEGVQDSWTLTTIY